MFLVQWQYAAREPLPDGRCEGGGAAEIDGVGGGQARDGGPDPYRPGRHH